jgi:hypothetical protein
VQRPLELPISAGVEPGAGFAARRSRGSVRCPTGGQRMRPSGTAVRRRSALDTTLRRVSFYLRRWAGKKYKRLRAHNRFQSGGQGSIVSQTYSPTGSVLDGW